MKNKSWLIACLTAVLLFAGCGSSSSSVSMAAADGIANTELYTDESNSTSASTSSSNEEISGDKLVYTGSLTLETLDYDTTVQNIRKRINDYNGIVESESAYSSGYDRTDLSADGGERDLSMTIRIPTEQFDEFLNSMKGEGRVTQKTSNVENITKQYNDNSIEIESLQKQQERLLQMLDQAESVEDMITIDSRLSDVETQLRQKKNEQSRMDTDVEYSTVTLQILEVKQYTPSGHEINGFAQRILNGLKSGGKEFVWFLQSVVVFAATYLPFIALAVVVVFLIHSIRKNRKKKESAQSSEEKKDVK